MFLVQYTLDASQRVQPRDGHSFVIIICTSMRRYGTLCAPYAVPRGTKGRLLSDWSLKELNS